MTGLYEKIFESPWLDHRLRATACPRHPVALIALLAGYRA
jgi:hypothetical protein